MENRLNLFLVHRYPIYELLFQSVLKDYYTVHFCQSEQEFFEFSHGKEAHVIIVDYFYPSIGKRNVEAFFFHLLRFFPDSFRNVVIPEALEKDLGWGDDIVRILSPFSIKEVSQVLMRYHDVWQETYGPCSVDAPVSLSV